MKKFEIGLDSACGPAYSKWVNRANTEVAPNHHQTKGSHIMAFTDRTFGVEIEFIGDRDKAVQAIRTAGLACHEERYDSSHSVPSEWKVTTDSSIGYENGELVSPILRGEAGLEQVRTVLKALRSIGHSVNKKCGVHVHVGARDLTGAEIANTFKRYQKHERDIDALMPVSRRANNNTAYINSLRSLRIDNATTPNEVRDSMGHCRYFKLNIMSYYRQKTIEFRQHSGSLSGEKVCNWVRFCVNFIEASRAISATTSAGTPARRRGRGPSANSAKTKVMAYFRERSYYMYDHNARDLGLNVDTLATVMSGLRTAGWEIRRVRDGGYYHCARIPTTPVVVAPVQACGMELPVFVQAADDTLFTGLDDSTVQFFRERAAEFAEQ